MSSLHAYSQEKDTISVLHYNLLNYGNYTSYCTTSNNNINDKDAALQHIINHTTPDIFTVNEVGNNSIYIKRLKEKVMNSGGRTYYEAADYMNNTGSSLVSGMFFNSNKLGLADQFSISKNGTTTLVRDICVYKLYYQSESLAGGDTTFLYVVAAHLKAGSSSTDATTRNTETKALMKHISINRINENMIFCADLNEQSSNAAAYQNLINGIGEKIIAFNDPIQQPGIWNNRSEFKDIHTQSTHYSGGCASSGGLDDRFDQILINGFIDKDSLGIRYIDGSYKAVGNDGNHFNSSVNYNGNTSVPSNVLQALYNMSDHLPVYMELEIDKPLATGSNEFNAHSPTFYFDASGFLRAKHYDVRDAVLFNILGTELTHQQAKKPGVYLVKWTDSQENVHHTKLWKQ